MKESCSSRGGVDGMGEKSVEERSCPSCRGWGGGGSKREAQGT